MNPSDQHKTESKEQIQTALSSITQIPAREIFKIVAAAIILTWLGHGFFNFVDAVLCGLGLYELDAGRGKFLAVSGIIQIVFSCFMLKSVSSLAEWVFPQSQRGDTSKDSASSSSAET